MIDPAGLTVGTPEFYDELLKSPYVRQLTQSAPALPENLPQIPDTARVTIHRPLPHPVLIGKSRTYTPYTTDVSSWSTIPQHVTLKHPGLPPLTFEVLANDTARSSIDPIHFERFTGLAGTAQTLREGIRFPMRPEATGYTCHIDTYPMIYESADNVQSAAFECDNLIRAGRLIGPFTTPPPVVSSWLLVDKKTRGVPTGKKRPCVDLTKSGVNSLMLPTPLTLPTIRDIAQLLQQHDYVSTFDISDMFLHFLVHPDMHQFLGVRHPGSGLYYILTVTMFGGKNCPAITCAFMTAVTRTIANRYRIPIEIYVDDGISIARTHAMGVASLLIIFTCFTYVGIPINYPKTTWPNRVALWIGVEIDTTAMVFRVPQWRKAQILHQITQALSGRQRPNGTIMTDFKLAESLRGRLQYVSPLVQGCTPFLSPLNRDIAIALNTSGHKKRYSPQHIVLSTLSLRALKWWLRCFDLWNGQSVWQLPMSDTDIYTDASNTGFGLVFGSEEVSETWSSQAIADSSINHKEMLAAYFALRRWATELANHCVRFHIDNTSAISFIKKGRAKTALTNEILERFCLLCATHNVRVLPVYINTKDNTVADSLSRGTRTSTTPDWKVPRRIFNALDTTFGPHEVDQMASPHNALVATYHTRCDSMFKYDMSHLNSWCNPDFSQIAQVLDHFLDAYTRNPSSTSLTLVLPEWPAQPWWPRVAHIPPIARFAPSQPFFTNGILGEQRLPWPIRIIRWNCTPSHPRTPSHSRTAPSDRS
jgi:hypothetical protein